MFGPGIPFRMRIIWSSLKQKNIKMVFTQIFIWNRKMMIGDLVLENTFYYFQLQNQMLKIIFTGVFRAVSNFFDLETFWTWKNFGLGNIVSNFSSYQHQNENWDSKHHKSKLKKSNIVEFESFPFEVLQIFGDYIYRVGRTLTVLELVQFFEFCHFLGLERVCKGQGSPDVTQF